MAILTLRPNKAGDETDIPSQYPNSGEHWDKVDDIEPDDNDTYVYSNDQGVWHRDLYNLPDNVGEGTIDSVIVYIRCNMSGTGYAKPSLETYGRVVDGDQITLTTSWTTYSQKWNTNPITDRPWTWDEILALQVGVNIEAVQSGIVAGTARCTQVYVEVYYTPPTPTPKKHPVTHLDKGPHPRSRLGFMPRLSL